MILNLICLEENMITDIQYFLSYRNYTSLFSSATMKTNKDAADEDSDDFMWYFSEQSLELLGCIRGDHEQLHDILEECIVKRLFHQRGDEISHVVVTVVKTGRCDSALEVAGRWYYITSLIPEVFYVSDSINFNHYFCIMNTMY